MQFITIFLLVGGLLLSFIGIVMMKNKENMFPGLSDSYIKFKSFSTIFIGVFSVILAIVMFLNKSIGNKGFYGLLIALAIVLILDKFMKKQA